MHSARLADERVWMCHVERSFSRYELECFRRLVDHAVSFAKGSRTGVLQLPCIYWDCLMRLTGVRGLDLLGDVQPQLSRTRELRNNGFAFREQ